MGECKRLQSKVAIISGSASGIGKSIALKLAEHGASVIVNYASNTRGADEVVSMIKKMDGAAIAFKADVSQASEAKSLVKRAIEEFGKLDILVNNAGIMSSPAPIDELPEEEWDRIIAVNLKGTFLCSQAAGREMIKSKKGCIINISSMTGHGPYPMGGAYSSSKAGVILFTQQLALEWAKYNIRVNSISPGTVVTPINEKVYTDKEIYEKRANIIPMHRPGYPEDIANASLFLASDESSYITGTDILVDGGLTKIAQQVLPGRSGGK